MPAELLAVQARQEAAHPDVLPVNVPMVARRLGIAQILPDRNLRAAGELRVQDGQPPAIHVRARRGDADQAGLDPRQSFTVAHELGHFLLYRDGMPVASQVGDPGIERYCDEFAASLLLPAAVVRERAHGTPGLQTVDALAVDAGVSMPAAFIALNRAGRWNAALLSWRRQAGAWRVSRAIVPYARRNTITSGPRLAEVLDRVGRGRITNVLLPLDASGTTVHVPADIVRRGECTAMLRMVDLDTAVRREGENA